MENTITFKLRGELRTVAERDTILIQNNEAVFRWRESNGAFRPIGINGEVTYGFRIKRIKF